MTKAADLPRTATQIVQAQRRIAKMRAWRVPLPYPCALLGWLRDREERDASLEHCMKAIVYDRFGPPEVLEQRALADPEPASGMARVAVHAAALNPKDVLLRKGKLRWLARAPFPRIPGYDVAGVLLDDAAGIAAGTPVYGMIQAHSGGACAQVARIPFDELAPAPPGLSMVEAASLPLVGLTALQALRDELGVGPGHRVLLNGASGGVGTVAIQIAKALGAEVTAVCSARNASLVRDLGADVVVDYQRDDLDQITGLDHVFDIYGTLPYGRARRLLRPKGRYCTAIPSPLAIIRGLMRRTGFHPAALVVVRSRRRDLVQLNEWVERGLLRPVVDRVLPLEEAVTAHAYLETRRARGKVVLEVRPA